MDNQKVELYVTVNPKEARDFHEALEKEQRYSNCNKGDFIMGFVGNTNEELYRAEVNMYASLEEDKTPWTEIVVYDKDDNEIYSSVEDIGIINKFIYKNVKKLNGKTLEVNTCFAYSKNVYQFAIDIVNTEGFFVQNNLNGSFYLMSKEFVSTTLDGNLFDNMKDLLDSLSSYHKKYVYSDVYTEWEEAINFLESEEVNKILEELTPKEVAEKQYAVDLDEDFTTVPNYTKYTRFYREWKKVFQIANQYNRVGEVTNLLNFLRDNMLAIEDKVKQEAQIRHIKDWEIADIPEKL